MAVRRWFVQAPEPNQEVDRNAVIQGLMDAEATLWRCGGVLTVLPYRQPTGLPGEMVTTGVVFEWKDRTDAKQQPERASVLEDLAPAPQAAPEPTPAPALVPTVQVAAPAPQRVPAVMGPPEDGLDEAALPEEDDSAIQEGY